MRSHEAKHPDPPSVNYKVKLELFEGPLDLLLYLIKQNELDIHDIPINVITDQYLEYLDIMQMLDLEVAGEFLVMAATLMHIKSKMLLPPPEMPEDEIPEGDPRAELVQRLLEYKRYKEAAISLQDLEDARGRYFTRVPAPSEIDGGDSLFYELSLFDLIRAFSQVLKNLPREILHEVIQDEFTVAEKVHEILHLLLDQKNLLFSELFKKARNRMEVITIFLAVLELIRLKEITVSQDRHLMDITIRRNTEHLIRPHA